VVVPLRDALGAATALIEDFARRYGNPKTRVQYVAELTDLFESSRRDHPLRRIPRLYGKVQGKYPARWLTYEEAFGTLLAACHDGTDPGVRDELLLRLGLAGLRAAEIIHLRMSDVHLDDNPPTIAWIGKASRSRRIVPGTQLLDLLGRYLSNYADNIGRPLQLTDPLVCREKPGAGTGQLSWGHPIAQTCSVRRIVGNRSAAAGLGHLSPHDLRRTAAGILHHATDEHGAHHFDLLDIQKVLDHVDPATTMRSYLDPIDTTVKERAANYLDWVGLRLLITRAAAHSLARPRHPTHSVASVPNSIRQIWRTARLAADSRSERQDNADRRMSGL
jgi:integrase